MTFMCSIFKTKHRSEQDLQNTLTMLHACKETVPSRTVSSCSRDELLSAEDGVKIKKKPKPAETVFASQNNIVL